MATFLDVAGVDQLSTILIFVFVIVAGYALLTAAKFPGPPITHILLAVILGAFVIISPVATAIAKSIAPWVAVFMLIAVFLLMAGKMVGGGAETTIVQILFYVFIFFIIVVGVGQTARDNFSIPGDNQTSGEFNRDYSQTSHVLFHPKVMGMILIFGVAIAAAALLVSSK